MSYRLNQRGAIGGMLIGLICVSLLAIATLSFAIWAFGQRQDYKNNSDQKVAAAVNKAVQDTKLSDAKTYQEEAQSPYVTYQGPDAYGSVRLTYPKTWSGYVDTTNGGVPVNGYFQAGVVPGINDRSAIFALRLQVVQKSYSNVLQQYVSLAKQGTVSVKPYKLPKVPSQVGSRIDGQLSKNVRGSLVVIPLRDKTLEVWTESTAGLKNFNGIILPNLTFAP
jgi:hypothetical protein